MFHLEAFSKRLLWMLVNVMTNQPLKNQYRSFLLRCICSTEASEGEEETAVWRFTLREVAAEPQEQVFSSIDDLANFLKAELNKKSRE